jgi:hypothetical protein
MTLPIPPPEPPEVTQRLREKGRETLGHETNLARAPVIGGRSVQLELKVPTVLYGRQFRQVSGQALTAADQRLYAELTTKYVLAGCPENHRVAFSLGEAARLLGHATLGGETRRLVRSSLLRLKAITIESALRDPAGGEDVMGWGLLDWYRTTTRGGGMGSVAISEQIAFLLQRGSITYLNAPTWDAISAQDQIAGRLWTFFEAENLMTMRRYQLFAAPPGSIAEERNMPAIAELLRLDWGARAPVAFRVRRALAVIARTDTRYQLQLIRGRKAGMWRVEAVRTKYIGGRPKDVLPPGVMAAWRGAYAKRRPSKKQVGVLREIIEQRGSLWVAARLSEEYPDPFRALMELDQAQRTTDHAAIIVREREWENQKRAEATDAHRLGDLFSGIFPPDDRRS